MLGILELIWKVLQYRKYRIVTMHTEEGDLFVGAVTEGTEIEIHKALTEED